MTDSEKLDLLLEKVTGLEKDMVDVKADLRRLDHTINTYIYHTNHSVKPIELLRLYTFSFWYIENEIFELPTKNFCFLYFSSQ